ncbi:MAG: SRPBCC family protein [Pseudomarimonas sp.]
MTSQTTHTILRATPEAAYDYLTRPALWKEWHHSSLGTEPHARESLRSGAAFKEDIRTVGIRKSLQWRVLDVQPQRRWEAEATMDDGSSAHLTYEFSAIPDGTRFTRTLSYTVKPWKLRLLNATLGWLKVRLESRQALRRLQRHFSR